MGDDGVQTEGTLTHLIVLGYGVIVPNLDLTKIIGFALAEGKGLSPGRVLTRIMGYFGLVDLASDLDLTVGVHLAEGFRVVGQTSGKGLEDNVA